MRTSGNPPHHPRKYEGSKFMQQGEFDDAIYEYFHSFNTDNPEDIIEDLKSA
jgi:hypothetical protein